MSKNLLITLGDSWTYGYGAYSPDALKEYAEHLDISRLHKQSDLYMKQWAWPTQLGQLIDYDLINLARGGSANGAHARWLINPATPIDTSGYQNVLVIWLLSEPSRLGLYTNSPYSVDHVLSLIPTSLIDGNNDYGPLIKQFTQLYVRLTTKEDNQKETEFYIKTVEHYCRSKGYGFVFGNAFSQISHENPCCLHVDHPFTSMSQLLNYSTISRVCGHPTDQGYTRIAQEIKRILTLRGLI